MNSNGSFIAYYDPQTKRFAHPETGLFVLYYGTVNNFDPTCGFYQIVYSDGDAEDMEFHEVQKAHQTWCEEKGHSKKKKQKVVEGPTTRRGRLTSESENSFESHCADDHGDDRVKSASDASGNHYDSDSSESIGEYYLDVFSCQGGLQHTPQQNYTNRSVEADGDATTTTCLWSALNVEKSSCKKLPKLKPPIMERRKEQIMDFFLFVYERQKIWERRNRANGQSGRNDVHGVWTKNSILRQHSFCNVYRELDRGTAYFHSRILVLAKILEEASPIEQLMEVLWASFIYRQINRIETFLMLGGIPTMSQATSFMKKFSHAFKKEVLFTAAHQTTNLKSLLDATSFLTKNNSNSLLRVLAGRLLEATSTEDSLCVLKELPLVGDFYSWQILCDLRESRCLPHYNDDFCRLGPGAKAGLGEIFGMHGKNKQEYLGLALALVRYHQNFYDAAAVTFPYWCGIPLGIKEIEHALCEYKKFKTLAKGSRRVRQRAFNSRYLLDKNKSKCTGCDRQRSDCNGALGYFCETCNDFCCQGCLGEGISGAFVCSSCDKLKKQKLKWKCYSVAANGSFDNRVPVG